MIARFPRPQPPPNPLGLALALHSEASRTEQEESLAWARWMFQSIRIRCDAIVFRTEATGRSGIIADWQGFAEQCWQPVIAPMLLKAWNAAHANDVASLLAAGDALGGLLPDDSRERSAAAGELLLRSTQGAMHQGVLGHLRQQLAHSRSDAHLAMVWAAVAVLFQLPAVDMLTEYLREEWLTGLREFPQPHEPQGPLSFPALAVKALHAAGLHTSFSVVEDSSLSSTA